TLGSFLARARASSRRALTRVASAPGSGPCSSVKRVIVSVSVGTSDVALASMVITLKNGCCGTCATAVVAAARARMNTRDRIGDLYGTRREESEKRNFRPAGPALVPDDEHEVSEQQHDVHGALQHVGTPARVGDRAH